MSQFFLDTVYVYLRQIEEFSIVEIIFLHYVARSFCEAIKLPKEMPKIAKCLKCLKLRNSIDFIKRRKQGM